MGNNEHGVSTLEAGGGDGLSQVQSIPKIQDIDELVVNESPDIGNARVTSAAQQVLNYDPEALIWQDAPSLSIMYSNVLKWVVIFIIWLIALAMISQASVKAAAEAQAVAAEQTEKLAKAQEAVGKKKKSKAADEANLAQLKAEQEKAQAKASKPSNTDLTHFLVLLVGVLVFTVKLFRLIARACSIACTKYSMTSQRLKIESGVFSKVSNVYELHNLGSGQVYAPFFLRFYGRSNLYVSGLWLMGIKNAETVRDLIRNAGQIEAGRFEKARFR